MNLRTRSSSLAVCASLALLLSASSLRAQTASPTALFSFDEGSGAIAHSSNGAAAQLGGAAHWGTGVGNGHDLSLSGSADSTAVIAGPMVDTSRSFSVSADVKLHRADGWQTFASIDGSQVSGFFLQLRGDTGEFAFTTLGADRPDSDTNTAGSHVEPIAGDWYHLTGVYDQAARTLSLYVDGKLESSVPYTTPWHAGGDTLIGRGKYGGNPSDFSDADIDNVRFYSSALSASDVAAVYAADLPMADRPLDPSQVVGNLTLHVDQPGPAIGPSQHGIMTEEINHSYDGGLYAETIQNRAFEDDSATPVHWSAIGGASATLYHDQPLSAALPVSLKLDFSNASAIHPAGIANDGYWGIPVYPNTLYRASLYARANAGYHGKLIVRLESNDGRTVYASGTLPAPTSNWAKYQTLLRTGGVAPTENARYVVYGTAPGTVWLNLVSLFPPTYHGRPNGNRVDLMEKLAALRPAFLRFPGGNYLEGDTVATRFDWKRTLGPLTQRPGHMGPWGYRSSDGMGMMEFLNWCDDLGMEPLLAVYAGYSLNKYVQPNTEHVAPGPALQPFVQDALDEIEFVTGAPSTKWGAVRARLGHPKPFALHYVEIGNEDFFDNSHSYDARFAQFYDAIKAKYPRLQLIATTGVSSRKPDVLDEHYYLTPQTFARDVHHYDNYDRNGPKIFVGEWASQSGNPTADLSSALGDAAWMTGMERNADVVIKETYAPLLVNVNPGASQWPHPNLIGYDALRSYGSPSYTMQRLFVTNRGNVVVPATLDHAPRLAQSVTRDTKTGMLYVKVVNTGQTAQKMAISVDGGGSISPDATAITFGDAPGDTVNSLDKPHAVIPATSELTHVGKQFTYTFEPRSFTVLRLQTGGVNARAQAR